MRSAAFFALVWLASCGPTPAPADAPGDSGPIDCEDLAGVWTVRVSRCGPAIVPSDVTIRVTGACLATLASPPGKGLPPVNGEVMIDGGGLFGPADLVVGSSTLSCTGAPRDSTGYLISCEPGCTITLER